MSGQDFAAAREVKVFLSSIPGQARPGEEEKREVYQRDERLRARLKTHLAPLCNAGIITLWHDGMLRGGTAWKQEIIDHLNAAEIILLLLSAEFLASDFCCEQMHQALLRMAKGVHVIPIYLRPIAGLEHLPVGKLAGLPAHGRSISGERDQDFAWYEVAEGVRTALMECQLASAPPLLQPTPSTVYRDILRKYLPVPRAGALAPRLSLVNAIYQRLTRTENLTGLILTGLSGAGKTTLAALVYYHAEKEQRAGRGLFARAPLWLNIEPEITLIDVIASLGKALEHALPPMLNDLTPEMLAEELFTLLEDADRLVIFNQFETWLDPQSGQMRPEHAGVGEWLALLNAGSEKFSGRVLLTSHFYPYRLFRYGEACIQQCDIAGLTMPEGIGFLRQTRAPALERAPDEELAALVEHCQGHILTLTALRERFIRDASLHPADLLSGEQQVDELLFQTLDALYSKQLKPGQRTLLQVFTLYREAAPLEAALAVASPGHRKADSRLSRVLLDLGWLRALDQKRYQLHPVIGDFVRKKISAVAQRAMHLQIAHDYQERFQRLSSPAREKSLEDFQALVEAIWHLCRAEQREEAYRLLQDTELFVHLHRWGRNSTLLTLYLDMLTAKNWQPAPTQAARLYHALGEIRNALGQKKEALQAYQYTLIVYRQIANLEGIVEALNDLGATHRALRAYPQARECYQEALHICEEAPHRIMQQGTTFNNLGRLIYEQGKLAHRDGYPASAQACYLEAQAYFEQALAWYQNCELVGEEAVALNNFGEVCQELGENEQARTCYWRALSRFQEQGDRRGEGLSLNNLGQLYQDMIRQNITGISIEEARACYEQALRLFRETGDRWQERIVLSNLGRCYPTCQEFTENERYQFSLACLVLARRAATELHQQDANIPAWIEATIRRWLAISGAQSYEAFLQEVEKQAEEIVRELLRKHK